jgi:hypothetical protein
VRETLATTEFYCIRCLSDTSHRITYLNNTVSYIECETCGRSYELKVDLKHELYEELLKRIKTKPSRITQEYRLNRYRLLKSFPQRVVKKPYRLFKEAKEVKHFIEKYAK